jgi:hypothetical protein
MMDNARFDDLSRRVGVTATRRATLHLLAAVLIGGLFSRRGIAPLGAAQRSDRDGDGLFDDDETNVYRTNPDLFDTDRDGTGDGEEIWNRDQGLPGPNDPLTPAGGGAPCPAGQFDCGAGCTDLNSDAGNCGTCGLTCDTANGHACVGGFCTQPVAPTCIALGGQCVGIDLPCCGNDPTLGYNNVLCCADLTGAGYCTDVTGRFLCPDPGVPATGCPVGMTNCGGFCTDVSVDHGNCGTCGNRCSQLGPDYNCKSSTCVRTCPEGLTDCFGRCVDIQSDTENCGGCGEPCRAPREDELIACQNGRCTGFVR